MSLREKQKLRYDIEAIINDIIYTLETDRYEPSERGAGTAPTQSALDNANEEIINIVEKIQLSGFQVRELFKDPTFEEIISEINSVQDNNIADDIDDLKEIDSFIRDNGEIKYRYINTVYEHKPSKRFICVEEQRGAGSDDFTGSINAQETIKKEIVKYEWS